MAKLTFIGACHEVTGSCFLLQTDYLNILIDCGMKQGSSNLQFIDLPIDENQIDYVLLTHAHIDHSGNLPLLYKKGFRGKVLCTNGTKQLCEIMLRDSAFIQMSDTEWVNKRNKRSGKELIEPTYDIDDADNVLKHFEGHNYSELFYIEDGDRNITIKFIDAGHLLGSSSIYIDLYTDGNGYKSLLFSGDIGNTNQPLIKNPVYPDDADYVIMESTYGNRNHEKPSDYIFLLADIINDTFDRGGNLVIPAFAVGRTQEFLYFIREIKEKNLVKKQDFKVYLDSPLANEATTIYDKTALEYCNYETRELIKKGINPIIFDGLIRTSSIEDSMKITTDPDPKIIISAAGMCDAGRIRHHLKHNLWRKECTVLFVGYQANGTLGRLILDGADTVRIFGEDIKVSAKVIQFPGISAHADQNGLCNWVNNLLTKPEKVFIVHGDEESAMGFCNTLKNVYRLDAEIPYSGAYLDLTTGEFENAIPRTITNAAYGGGYSMNRYISKLFEVYEKLGDTIHLYENGTNEDVKKFTTQINDLIERWED